MGRRSSGCAADLGIIALHIVMYRTKAHLRTHAVPLDTSVGAIRWLDSVGTPVGVQQRLMRHSDIRTTMNIYGDAVTPNMREAHDKIVGLAPERHGKPHGARSN